MCSQASRWAILLLLSLFPSYVGSESLCVASVLRWPFVYVCVCMCLPPRLSWTHHSSRLPTAACKQVLLPPTRPTAEDGSPMEDEHFLLLHVITPEQSGLLPRPAQMLIFTLTASFSLRNEGTVWGNAHAHSLAHSASWPTQSQHCAVVHFHLHMRVCQAAAFTWHVWFLSDKW